MMTTARRIGLIFGPILMIACLAASVEAGSPRAWRAGGMFALMAAWWFTEALPIGVTAALPLVLFPLFGIVDGGAGANLATAAGSYVEAYVLLFLGGMVVGAALEEQDLHRRVALNVLRVVGTSPSRLVLGVLVSTSAVSMWMSNTATAVMMLPIAMALLKQTEVLAGRRLERFGSATVLAVAWGANIGGLGTKIGTGTNSIFTGFVADKLGRDLGFGEYMLVGTPLVLLLVPLAWAVLWSDARHETHAPTSVDSLAAELAAMGPMKRGERQVAVVFGVAATLWATADLVRPLVSPHFPVLWEGFKFQARHYEAIVGLAAGAVAIALRLATMKTLRRVPWDTLLLLGGSFALAAGIEGSGLGGILGQSLTGLADLPFFAQAALVSVATVALSAVASNTATVNVMLNVLPRNLPIMTTACFASSLDFALPAGTPPNAIVFGSGRIRLPVMMRLGAVMDIASALLTAAYSTVWVTRILER